MLDIFLESERVDLSSLNAPSLPETGTDLLKVLKPKKRIYVMKIDNVLKDLSAKLPAQGRVEFCSEESSEALEVIRHGTAHVLAQAVKALEPEVQVTIGPVIDGGFYYDFSRKEPFKEEDLPKLEEKMKEIIKSRFPVRREDWAIDKAISYFKGIGEHYKVEIIEDLVKNEGVQTVSVYSQGDFLDLCRGPHVPDTGHIPAFKLTHVAGAYWRGNENNEMLTRVYGTAFASKEALKEHLHRIEEAKKRDHRRLGIDQKLFSFHTEAPAAPFFHPSGAFVYAQIQEFLRSLNRKNGFQDVISPLVMSDELWKKSGHYDNYRENMYFTKIDERDFAVKPMNCPGHCLIYSVGQHSYRDLPLRFAEFGRVHRHERSGVTAGLFRVRSFVQDDAHVFCTEDQIESEILRILSMIRIVYGVFDFEFSVELSTRPEKRIGSEETWDKAEASLAKALKAANLPYKLNPGDGAFYGPKIDFHLKDSIGRTHQCGTIQLDFSMPGRFGLEFVGQDNVKHTPVMIHRAIIGSFERFLGIYIEHVAGKFPMWLSYLQAAIITIGDESVPFARELYQTLQDKGYRVKIDDSADKLSAKIKNFQAERPAYMIIIGAREAQEKVVSLRDLSGNQRQGVNLETLFSEFASANQPIKA